MSPASLQRLKAQWQLDDAAWKRERLDELGVVYVWADGLYVKAGLEDSKPALLVMIGALTDGRKVVQAVESVHRMPLHSMWMEFRTIAPPGRRSPPDSIYTPIDKTSTEMR